MPLVRYNKNDIRIVYDIPKRKKNLLTKEFLKTFKEELDNIFNKENDFEPLEKRNYWNTYQYMESTCGFYKALRITCEKHNLTKAIYEYASKMPYYDSDLFDGELTLLMVEKEVIEKGSIDETSYDYENDDYFELKITEKKYKDYTVVKKDWVLKEKNL